MNKELRDQSAHFGSCFGLTLITAGFGAHIVILWAITREYYQHKSSALTFFENITILNYFNLDLKWSYGGVVLGIIVSAAGWFYLLS
jgi:hypothetical protein